MIAYGMVFMYCHYSKITLTYCKSINSHNSLGLRMTWFHYDYITIDFKQHEIMQIIMIACAMFFI
jgi:hypothetical protein